METRFLLKVVLILVVIGTSAAMDQTALKAIAHGNMGFTANLYKVLKEKEGNIFFSPISIEVVLALASMGAAGSTAEQMIKSLQLPHDKSTTQAGFRALMETLKSNDNMILEIANKVFGQKSFKISDEFKLVAEKAFLSAAQEMDFTNDAEGSRQTINHWVEERTRNKICDLIPTGEINPLTRLVLVNAVYFKGLWANQFNPERTETEPFHVSATEKKDVRMMHIKKKFRYGEIDELQAKVLVMPYKGDQISLVIMLPYEMEGLPKLEEKLDGLNLGNLINTLHAQEVEVSLPRFKLEETIDLNEPLKKLGMTDMFSERNADFSGISSIGPGLYVSKVLQKAFIEVNEEGSEAAAATAMIMAMRMMFDRLEFVANHPFIFALLDTSRTILFLGRYASPNDQDF